MVPGENAPPTAPQLFLLFTLGAALVMASLYIIRSLVIKTLEPAGRWLDRWRRHGFEPERDLALLLGNFLILAFLLAFDSRYGLPQPLFYFLAAVWMLRLPGDMFNLLMNRASRPAAIHRRAFFLYHFGPLWVRGLLAFLAFGAVFGLLALRII